VNETFDAFHVGFLAEKCVETRIREWVALGGVSTSRRRVKKRLYEACIERGQHVHHLRMVVDFLLRPITCNQYHHAPQASVAQMRIAMR
jgi:hypothetical protein